MIRKDNLHTPRLPGKTDKRVRHDWRRQPDASIDQFEWRLETARNELVADLHRTAKRLGCAHYSGAPDDPLSVVFSAFDDKIDQALSAFRRTLR